MQTYRSRDEILHSIARRQRKLIPLNIVVVIISLVAALTLMFSPLITIDLSNADEIIAELIGSDEDAESEEESEIDLGSITSAISGTKFSFTTYSMTQFAFSDDPVEYISGKVTDMLSSVADALITEVMLPAIVSSLDAVDSTIEITEDDAEAILEKFKALGEVSSGDDEARDSAIQDLFVQLQESLGADVLSDEAYDEFYESVRDIYDETVEVTGGNFSVETLVGTYTSELIDSALGEYIYTVIDILKVASVVMIFFAAVWGILFLFAFFHMFSKNKRFTMWYVKMFGCWPCMLFGVVPLAIPSLLTSLLGESAAIVEAIFGMISSTTWVSGVCYLLLWFISIFWAFPIKRKIRADKKELKRAQY